ncbi:hypothetical protein SIN8267_00338 [Sinobacterium norvegicum]|uniref:Tyr recombinase domain-containing protein n=1 Tax=Sinobacterium norvegicum TaxID=1641715 RepID=A0ABN8ECP2_9GAMM|nr:site-specific integrase [Sinobacterium norvegicum]CAH0990246.1 hypothetical protein SIN8267_00338 [Sinobacterium norvegicum]
MRYSSDNLVAELLLAAVNDNTEQAIEQARFHYEVVYGGKLPCSADQLHAYLAFYGGKLSVATLEQRKALLAKWHRRHHHIDPTKTDAETTRELMRGIRKRYNKPPKQAKSLSINTLSLVVDHLEGIVALPVESVSERAMQLQALRNRALLLIGFWFGLRASSLVRLKAEQLQIDFDRQPPTLTIYLADSKTDREARGEQKSLKMLQRLCPVAALIDWLAASQIEQGYVFSKVTRWGCVESAALLPNSLNKLIRTVFRAAGIDGVGEYSSHSLRRGAANWIAENGGDLHAMMDWIGWKDVKSAMRYRDQVSSLPNKLIETRMALAKDEVQGISG